jgi:hypothetical protein
VAYHGKLYLFGIGINDHGHYMNTFNGVQWSGWSPVPGGGTTLLADTAAVCYGKLYLFGIGINDHEHYVNTFNGVNWSGWSVVPSRETRSGVTTLVPDAAVAYYGNLYLFRVDPNDHKHYVNVLGQVRSTL